MEESKPSNLSTVSKGFVMTLFEDDGVGGWYALSMFSLNLIKTISQFLYLAIVPVV